MRLPRPTRTRLEAAAVARRCIGHGVYQLGKGNADTLDDEEQDCAGFASNKCHGIPRHRKGFAKGGDVEDDLNSNSAIWDAEHEQDLYERATRPAIGDILAYPTIRIRDEHGELHTFIGHEAIVIGVDRVLEWNPLSPDWSLIDIAQCCGPNGRKPGVIQSTGAAFNHHDEVWSKPQHRTRLLRVKP